MRYNSHILGGVISAQNHADPAHAGSFSFKEIYMKEVPAAVVKAGITLAVVAASPFVAKAANGLADKDNWQWWSKSKDSTGNI